MNNINPTEKTKSPSLSCFIRLTPEQHAKIREDEKRSGRSVPELFKNAYFGGGRVVILMSDEDKGTLFTQINRIGSNVNQIAKKLNTGIIFGFDQELTQVRILLTHLLQWVNGKYKNPNEQKGRL